MAQRTDHEQRLLNLAHQVLSESRQIMLPHHFDIVSARSERFDEISIHEVHATGINRGRFITNILFLTHAGQRVSLTREQQRQDTIIVDLSTIPDDLDSMRRILLTTELYRKWHHAPWLAINLIKQRKL